MAASDALTAAPGGRAPAAAPSAGDARLGTGVRFPFRPASAGALAWVTGAAAVRQSVETLLDTEPGERIMRPTFGCGLRRHLMAPNTPATRTAIAAEIAEALTVWEPRIRVTEVSVTPGEEPTLVWIDIAYVHLLDLRPDNLVYPFYLR
ncbi:GPW/gp25 family protein [Streptomyces sp. NPDC059456]|uniref:GPW/gp25 family protein n=1 Tax=Streptomyces sp. NPDC059456 TaxID=3346838 RepID=UPI0036CADBCD